MKIRDVMTRQPITAFADETVSEVAKRMYHHGISGLPVIDGNSAVIGMVTEGDLLHRRELATERHRSWWLDLFCSNEDRAHEYLKSHGTLVRDVITRSIESIGPDDSLSAAADILERKNIKRLPVVRDGRLIGVLSRADLIRALAIHYVPKESPSPHAQAMRDRFYEELAIAEIATTSLINAIVEADKIYLWGMVESEVERAAVEASARQLPGIDSVENNLGVRPMVMTAE